MKKLGNKTFFILVSILSSYLFVILFIFNIWGYQNEYNDIRDKISRIAKTQERFQPNINNFRDPFFVDMNVYIISFDVDGRVKNISNYTSDGLSDEDIIKLFGKVDENDVSKIGNLYFNRYIYSYSNAYDLIIIDNYYGRNFLINMFVNSLIIFFILEIVIIYVCYIITRWLVKPVEDSFNKQRQFIYDASHELKTPISIIMASAETLENHPSESKWLDNIKSESVRMNKLVVDMLELSKMEELDENIVFSSINLSKIIRSKALSFESLMYENNLNLILDIEDDISICGNADRIKELLSILIDNAIKHAYDKSDIKVVLHKEKNSVILDVINRGDEILVDDREKIFERFYRADKSRNRDSNRYGLGLAIAKNIVNNHNGSISVSCLDGYTTFRVIFK